MTMAVNFVNRVHSFRQLRALVIGDAMLDTYYEGTAARLCSEGPVPVVRKTAELHVPGGAANTAANLRALDAGVIFLGIVGRDRAASLLRSALKKQDIDDSWLIADESASTLHKLRILADGQYVVRFDDEETNSYSVASQQQLLNQLEAVFPLCDLVVISDYCYGVITDGLIERLQALLLAHPKVLLVDSKDLYRFRDAHATVITPNKLEAQLLTRYSQDFKSTKDESIVSSETKRTEIGQVAEQVLKIINAESIAITLAEEGVFLLDRQGSAMQLPAHPVQHANDIGAGDSFAAALSLSLAAGANIEEAARIAIDAAGIAVTKRWTSIVYSQELLQRVSLRDHAALSGTSIPMTGAESREAHFQLLARLDVERADKRTIVFTNGVFDILHAGHIHFLRQAKALGDVLVVGVNSDNSAQRLKGKNRPIMSERDRLALVAALDPVDHVVLFDEDTPTELIRALRPHLHVKGGDYADEVLPEAGAVQEVGGRIIILPLAGSLSTSSVIDRIIAMSNGGEHAKTSSKREVGVEE